MQTRYVDCDAAAGGNGTTNALSGANCAYTSLSAWNAARAGVLSEPEECICGSNDASHTADTTNLDLDGWTTSAANYISIKTDANSRASASWSDSKYRHVLDGYNWYVREQYVRFDGIQFRNTTTDGTGRTFYWISFDDVNNAVYISNCHFRGPGGDDSVTWKPFNFGSNLQIKIWNCLAYGFSTYWNSYEDVNNAAIVVDIYNTVIIGNESMDMGIRREDGTLRMKNCYVCGGSYGAYYGTITKTTCASDDTTGDTGLQNIACDTSTGAGHAGFTNVTAGSEDFHLKSGSALIDVGTDTSGDSAPLNFTTDIDGETRSGTWDIGCDEYVAAGGLSIPVFTSLRSRGWRR